MSPLLICLRLIALNYWNGNILSYKVCRLHFTLIVVDKLCCQMRKHEIIKCQHPHFSFQLWRHVDGKMQTCIRLKCFVNIALGLVPGKMCIYLEWFFPTPVCSLQSAVFIILCWLHFIFKSYSSRWGNAVELLQSLSKDTSIFFRVQPHVIHGKGWWRLQYSLWFHTKRNWSEPISVSARLSADWQN